MCLLSVFLMQGEKNTRAGASDMPLPIFLWSIFLVAQGSGGCRAPLPSCVGAHGWADSGWE